MKNASVLPVDDAAAELHVFHRVRKWADGLGRPGAARRNGNETTSALQLMS